MTLLSGPIPFYYIISLIVVVVVVNNSLYQGRIPQLVINSCSFYTPEESELVKKINLIRKYRPYSPSGRMG